jgi:hypothetical protein
VHTDAAPLDIINFKKPSGLHAVTAPVVFSTHEEPFCFAVSTAPVSHTPPGMKV